MVNEVRRSHGSRRLGLFQSSIAAVLVQTVGGCFPRSYTFGTKGARGRVVLKRFVLPSFMSGGWKLTVVVAQTCSDDKRMIKKHNNVRVNGIPVILLRQKERLSHMGH